MRSDRKAPPEITHAFVCRGLDADFFGRKARRGRESFLHFRQMRLNLRLLRNQRRVNVHQVVAQLYHFRSDALQQDLGIDVPVSGIVVRKKMPDVRQTRGAQNRVADGVGQAVRVRVTIQSIIRGKSHSAEHERTVRHDPVNVVAMPNAIIHPRQVIRIFARRTK